MGISNYFSCDTDEEAEKPDNCNENEDKTSSKGYYWAQFIAGFSSKFFLTISILIFQFKIHSLFWNISGIVDKKYFKSTRKFRHYLIIMIQ